MGLRTIPSSPRTIVQQYRTEIVIPPDHYVCLQLPPDLPEGRAIVTVLFQSPQPAELVELAEPDLDRQDIEWWDEFEDDRERVSP
jgi:hypothetical protein